METVKERIEYVKNEIENAKKRVGREDCVTLVAVTKTHGVDTIREAYNSGLKIFGENRVQEMMEKFDSFEDVSWHLIGHLQKNKVKYVVGKAKLIHSVDSLELCEEINRAAQKCGIVQDILLEVNISGEITKYGLTTAQIKDIISEIRGLRHIRVRGIMTMAPLTDDKDLIRSIFKQAKDLFDLLKEDNPYFDTLSMGMSSDFTIAVEEGATMVRVGSLIFGKRIYR